MKTARTVQVPVRRDPVAVIQSLRAEGLAKTFLLYSDPAREEVRIACDPIARISVTREAITLQSPTLGIEKGEAVRDPFAQAGALLSSLPLAGPRAYGYLAFDLARFSFAYQKTIDAPLLDLFVPTIELVVTPKSVQVRTYGDPIPVVASLANEPAVEGGPRLEITLDPNDRRAYTDRVASLVDDIRGGALRKAILSRRVEVEATLDPLATFVVARSVNGAARAYAFDLGHVRGAGFSPEIFLESPDGRTVTTNPLAGTRPRGQTPEEDARIREELFDDSKEVKEHALSIWLAQEEMRAVCDPSSVRIHSFMEVKPFRCVQHLSSRVSGALAEGKTTWDAARVLFPGITVSGIDKAAAIRAIDRLEDAPRGIYGGAVGWVDGEGRADLAIAIRSVYQYGKRTCLNAGAGIVAESVPEREYVESVNKMSTMLSQVVLGG